MELLQRDTSPNTVLEVLRTSILEGAFVPGSQLKQSILATQLGVSQGPVREALSRLVEEGLVENVPYRGMFVRVLTEKDVDEIYQVRGALECLAARLALPRVLPDHLSELQELVAQALAAGRSTDQTAAVKADLNFHSYLVELSDNSRLIKVWNSLLAQSFYLLRSLYALQPDRAEGLLENHQAIVDALRNRDYDTVEEVLEQHMDFARVTLLEQWSAVSHEWDHEAET